MHDPYTVAFRIPNPLAKRYDFGKRWRDRPPLITVWHRDPERDGSDDSCGWFAPRLTKEQIERIKGLAWVEAREKRYFPWQLKKSPDDVQAMFLCRELIRRIGHAVGFPVSLEEAESLASERVFGPEKNDFGCFLPGWHSNFKEDLESSRRDHAERVFCSIARDLLGRRRHRWQHPRWHVWHWRIHVHPWRAFQYRFLERCCECRVRLKGGRSFTHFDGGPGERWCEACNERKLPSRSRDAAASDSRATR